MMLIMHEEKIQNLFSHNIFLLAKAYQRFGAVHELELNTHKTLLNAKVYPPTDKAFYVVNMTSGDSPASLQCRCTCMKAFCVHMAVALLEANKVYGHLLDEVDKNANVVSEKLNMVASYLTDHFSKKIDQWSSKIQTLQTQPQTIVPVTKTDSSIFYLLKVNPKDPVKLEIHIRIAKILRRGGVSHNDKAFNYMADSHFKALLPIDHELLHRMEILYRQKFKHYKDEIYRSLYEIAQDPEPSLLADLIKTGRCFWDTHQEHQPLVLGPALSGELIWEMGPEGEQFVRCRVGEQAILPLPVQPVWYLNPVTSTCGPLTLEAPIDAVRALLTLPQVMPQNIENVKKILTKKFPKLSQSLLPQALPTMIIERVQPKPKLRLFGARPKYVQYFDDEDEMIIPIGRISFFYDTWEVSIYSALNVNKLNVEKKQLESIRRDLKAEEAWIVQLLNTGVAWARTYYGHLPFVDVYELDVCIAPTENQQEQEKFFTQAIPTLRNQGWIIEIDKSFPLVHITEIDDWYTELHEDLEHDWFSMEVGVLFEGQKVNILPILVKELQRRPEAFTEKQLANLAKKNFELTLPDGQRISFPGQRLKGILETLTELYDDKSLTQSGLLPMARLRAASTLALEQAMSVSATGLRWIGHERLKNLHDRLMNFQGIQSVSVPAALKGTLRNYQQEGLSWLNFLREYHLGGILADDMGLGKTIQTLAFLLLEKQENRLTKPCLIVAPTSLMQNWASEAEKFAPSLKTLVLQGQTRKVLFSEIQTADLVLTTYLLLVHDKEILTKQSYYLVILDEAQFIKNSNTKAYSILQTIHADHRLCLTGTPMENHLGELWSLFNFLSPGLLGTAKQFNQVFRSPIERQGDKTRRQWLHQRLKPYLLRRTKEQVVLELPPKTEIMHHIVLEEPQRDLYESIRLAMETKVKDAIHHQGFAKSQILILDALLKLRQVCCDPRLLKLKSAQQVVESAKLKFLLDMLTELVAEGKKILLFSSFVSMLSFIEQALQERSFAYVKLTGSTVDRKTPIEQFQNGKIPIFLISLKAGGTGLNLTAADTVIHYDPWWNPAAEAQASDRAHRIGQTKPVFVYKLVTTGTVEEKIVAMQDKKRELLQSVFSETVDSANKVQISSADLEFLFQPVEALSAEKA